MKFLPLGLQSVRGIIMSGTLNIIISLLTSIDDNNSSDTQIKNNTNFRQITGI
jgi:hypothetical protein